MGRVKLVSETKSYRDLLVWQRSMDAVVRIYKLVNELPKDERFSLADQMRRAAISIPSNTAEGHGRHSTKSFIYHLRFARGSLAELETQVLLAVRLEYVGENRVEALLSELDEISKMLAGLVRSLNPED